MSDVHKRAVRAAFGNFVMVNKTLVQYFKDANPALLLGYFISEDKNFEESGKPDSYGYFYCKADKIERKFGYSRKVQDTILKHLVDAGLLEIFNKRIEGSECLSKVKHFKVLHTNIYNLVNKIQIPTPEDNLHPRLLDIKQALIAACKDRQATWVPTANDEEILGIALIHGLSGKLITDSIYKKHKRLKSKRVSFKYLLTGFIPNIEYFENLEALPKEKHTIIIT